MRKLRLDDLAVESFQTHTESPLRGTVDGKQVSDCANSCELTNGVHDPTCWQETCVRADTCYQTCAATCAASCQNTDCPAFCGGGGGNICKQSASCIEDTERAWVGVPY